MEQVQNYLPRIGDPVSKFEALTMDKFHWTIIKDHG